MCRRKCKWQTRRRDGSYGDVCNYLSVTGKSRLAIMRKMLQEAIDTNPRSRTEEQRKLIQLVHAAEKQEERLLQLPVDTRDPVMRAVLHAYCPCYEPREPGQKKEYEWLLNGEVVPKTRKRRTYTYVPPAPEEELMRLYNMGLNDRQIADKVGNRSHNIKAWRNKRELPSKAKTAKKRDDDKLMRLYREGYGDGEIAKRTGMSKNEVWTWRKKQGLPANLKPGERERNNQTGG